jgi:hypothetical protein
MLKKLTVENGHKDFVPTQIGTTEAASPFSETLRYFSEQKCHFR